MGPRERLCGTVGAKAERPPGQRPFSGEGCIEKVAVQRKKRGTVPVCEERSLAFVFGLDEEAELLTTSTTGL